MVPGDIHGSGSLAQSDTPNYVSDCASSSCTPAICHVEGRVRLGPSRSCTAGLEWAQAQGHVAAVAFPQDAMPKRRRKQQTTPEPEAPSEQPQAGN